MIAISAITCLGVASTVEAIRNISASENIQVEDLGLEYEDGWYLINSAQDYYVMQYLQPLDKTLHRY